MAGLVDPHHDGGGRRGARPFVIPVLTPAEMAGVDRQAPEPAEVLIARAGAAVARRAASLLANVYQGKVIVVAGKGNNGADGRTAASLLARQGARVQVLEAAELAPGQVLEGADLVIDAAYGTGLQRAYEPPVPSSPVLAVDIPSGWTARAVRSWTEGAF